MEDLLEGLLTSGGHHALLVHGLIAVGICPIRRTGVWSFAAADEEQHQGKCCPCRQGQGKRESVVFEFHGKSKRVVKAS